MVRSLFWMYWLKENDGTISTSVYRKKTHTDQYLNCPHTIRQCIKRLWLEHCCSRVNTICSSTHDRAGGERRVTAALKTYGYPSGFILSRSRTHRDMEGSQREPETTAVLPYICSTAIH